MAELQNINGVDFQKEVLESDAPVLVDFWAPWCGPCRAVGPVLERIAEESGLRIVKLNIDENQEMAQRYRVSSVPMMILFKQGTQLKKIVGSHPKRYIEEQIRSVLG